MTPFLWALGTGLTALAVAYAVFLCAVFLGLSRLRAGRTSGNRPFVTILVAARNEERFLGACLESLAVQTYPRDSHEIIIIDDGSNDGTPEVIGRHSATTANVRSLRIERGGSKPTALTRGVEAARGEIILTTDADCVVRPTWVSSMISRFNDRTVFVAGPVVEQKRSGILAGLSRLEFLGLIGVAAGLIGIRVPVFCNGANLAFRRSAFLAVGGYGEGQWSDDEALLQRLHGAYPDGITYAAEDAAIVATEPPGSVVQFWRQRVRWSSKRRVYERKRILFIPIVLYCYFAVLLLAVAIAAVHPILLPLVTTVLAFKVICELAVLVRTSTLFRQEISWRHLLIAEVLHVPYIVLAAFQGQTGLFRWKGDPNRS